MQFILLDFCPCHIFFEKVIHWFLKGRIGFVLLFWGEAKKKLAAGTHLPLFILYVPQSSYTSIALNFYWVNLSYTACTWSWWPWLRTSRSAVLMRIEPDEMTLVIPLLPLGFIRQRDYTWLRFDMCLGTLIITRTRGTIVRANRKIHGWKKKSWSVLEIL
jgi:hypothetical protein